MDARQPSPGPWPGMAAARAPDLAEPIVGWRAWRVGGALRARDARLVSLVWDAVWEPRSALRADCLQHRRPRVDWRRLGIRRDAVHHAPGIGCTCGVYAAREPEQVVRDYLDGPRGTFARGVPCVFGTVSLWGRVVEYSEGFRAEWAYPAELLVPGADAGPRSALARTLVSYGVPIVEVPCSRGADLPEALAAVR